MELLKTILIIAVPTFVLANEIATRIVYKRLLSNKEIKAYIDSNINGSWINSLDDSIICTPDGHISSTFSIFSHYCISEFGRVPRWGKSHKLIEEMYKTLANQ